MSMFISLAELGNYILFSILVGHVALQFVSEKNKPQIEISKHFLLLSTLGIIIFTLGPIVQVITYFEGSVGLPLAIYSVLTDFQVGRAWLFIGFMATFLWMTIYVEGSKYLQAFWLLMMILAVGYASHIASLSLWTGLVTHVIHFLMVTLWVGVLIHVTWFSTGKYNWKKFLKWFTPFAIVCLLIVVISGISLMLFVVEPKDYVNSWVLPYGQMLLLKHISIIPVLVFAFMNGVLAKKSLKHSAFNPLPWLKGESILLLLVFYFTSVMGTLSPPHEVEFTVKTEGASQLLESLLGTEIISSLHLQLVPTFQSSLLMFIAIIFLSLILVSFKKVKPILSVVFGLSFIMALYLGIMLSLFI
ncbi:MULTISPECIES: copper resistance D family protein [unclassified Bacillus (in: firmicutes)]|uniref:copper resistance D family protein n=1 Tax=unclassified Bacillus (in: firmicutes) TaxID=185979 RepID=UPI0008E6A15D|nr:MULTISPECIES: CopD family protein [unclassified Bacillus (in: firmicutes)]SFA80722.1 putative copper resistance protein D [Bacillus sp. UNCCL13]SFQ70850.1 putative copper resistance protein D [Bacillus sp. cl95]